MPKKSGLGRGLIALVNETSGETYSGVEKEATSIEVPIEEINPNENQPRTYFDEDKLASLTESILEVGILQPILVRKVGDSYEIIAGERRYQAAKRAGLKSVPIIVRDSDQIQSLQLALIENIQRSDLTAVEEAIAYKELIDKTGMTQEELGKRLSKSRSTIANTIRLLDLSQSIQEKISDGVLSAGHARALLSMDDEAAREELAEKIIREDLSVRQAEKLASAGKQKKKEIGKRPIPQKFKAIARQLTDSIGTSVKIKSNKENLLLEIECEDEDVLMGLIDLLDSKR